MSEKSILAMIKQVVNDVTSLYSGAKQYILNNLNNLQKEYASCKTKAEQFSFILFLILAVCFMAVLICLLLTAVYLILLLTKFIPLYLAIIIYLILTYVQTIK